MDGMIAVLRLVDVVGKIEGRKKLQKIVHILQSRGFDFPHDFGYLHYGPYSSGLAAEVDALVSSKFVIEQRGVGYEPYVYTPSKTVGALFEYLGETQVPPWRSLAISLNSRDANFLESLSTILYLQENGFLGRTLKERFIQLKPTLRRFFEAAIVEASSLPTA
jgi:uncharacterized protein